MAYRLAPLMNVTQYFAPSRVGAENGYTSVCRISPMLVPGDVMSAVL